MGIALFSCISGGLLTWIYFRHATHALFMGAKKMSSKAESIDRSTRVLVLDPFLVNLSDPDGNSYLRLALALRLQNGNAKGTDTTSEKVELRDTILDVLARQSSEELLSPNGKEILKKQIMQAFSTHNEQEKVVSVYFTEVLVQR
jgi:flagellar FliL protein